MLSYVASNSRFFLRAAVLQEARQGTKGDASPLFKKTESLLKILVILQGKQKEAKKELLALVESTFSDLEVWYAKADDKLKEAAKVWMQLARSYHEGIQAEVSVDSYFWYKHMNGYEFDRETDKVLWAVKPYGAVAKKEAVSLHKAIKAVSKEASKITDVLIKENDKRDEIRNLIDEAESVAKVEARAGDEFRVTLDRLSHQISVKSYAEALVTLEKVSTAYHAAPAALTVAGDMPTGAGETVKVKTRSGEEAVKVLHRFGDIVWHKSLGGKGYTLTLLPEGQAIFMTDNPDVVLRVNTLLMSERGRSFWKEHDLKKLVILYNAIKKGRSVI